MNKQNIVTTLEQFQAGEASEYAALRAIAAYPDWHVLTNADSHALLWTIDGDVCVAAMATEESASARATQWMRMSGRHLLRHIPADAEGIAFEMDTPHCVFISKQRSLEVALYWASVVDVEDALTQPAQNQYQRFLDHRWWVVCESGHELPALVMWDDLLAVHLFTAPDIRKDFMAQHPDFEQFDVLLMPGAELFALLDKLNDFDGIVIHSNTGNNANWEPLAPNAPTEFLAGRDPRPEANILRAKSIAEIHLFLDHMGISREDRRHRMEYMGQELVARYDGAVREGPHAGKRREFAFYPVMPMADPFDLGSGPSEILCAGVMADSSRIHLSLLRNAPSEASNDDRERAQYIARWACELEKMLPEGEEALLRQVIRTARGGQYIREHPEMMTREWITWAREQSEAFLV